MAGFIEEFYYGNIDPQARRAKPDNAVRKEMQTLTDYEEELTNLLTGDEKKKYLSCVNAWGVVNCEGNLDGFTVGFRLGAAFMQDTFLFIKKAPYTNYLRKKLQSGTNPPILSSAMLRHKYFSRRPSRIYFLYILRCHFKMLIIFSIFPASSPFHANA